MTQMRIIRRATQERVVTVEREGRDRLDRVRRPPGGTVLVNRFRRIDWP